MRTAQDLFNPTIFKVSTLDGAIQEIHKIMNTTQRGCPCLQIEHLSSNTPHYWKTIRLSAFLVPVCKLILIGSLVLYASQLL